MMLVLFQMIAFASLFFVWGCNMLFSFLQTGLNVGVIMESEIVWEKFRLGCGFPDPYVVHFPNYNKGQQISVAVQQNNIL
jgi:hypothetical protein